MTLIAGIVCKDAVILAADTEESGTIRKSNVTKISETLVSVMSGTTSSVIIAGAGNGTLADYATQKIMIGADRFKTLSQAEAHIVKILDQIHRVNVPLHPVSDPSDAWFELLIGVKTPELVAPVLYSTQGITMVRRDRYYVSGSGSLVDYVLDQIYQSNMSSEDGATAALYMLQIAKKYVGGVGGDSHIRILRNDGQIGLKPPWEVSDEENLVTKFSEISSRLLLSTLRTRTGTDKEFADALKSFNNNIRRLRRLKHKSAKWMDVFEKEMLKKAEKRKKKEA